MKSNKNKLSPSWGKHAQSYYLYVWKRFNKIWLSLAIFYSTFKIVKHSYNDLRETSKFPITLNLHQGSALSHSYGWADKPDDISLCVQFSDHTDGTRVNAFRIKRVRISKRKIKLNKWSFSKSRHANKAVSLKIKRYKWTFSKLRFIYSQWRRNWTNVNHRIEARWGKWRSVSIIYYVISVTR